MISNEVLSVVLRHVVPETNKRRQYSLTVGQDLFGTPMVTCRWGRIGRGGQTKDHLCKTLDDAKVLAARLVRRRQRRGYQMAAGQGRWLVGKSPTAAVTIAARTVVRQRRAKGFPHPAQLTLGFPVPSPATRGKVAPRRPRVSQNWPSAQRAHFSFGDDTCFREERVSAAEGRERAIARATGPCTGANTPQRGARARAVQTKLSPRPWNTPQMPVDKQRALDQVLAAMVERGLPFVGRAEDLARPGFLRRRPAS